MVVKKSALELVSKGDRAWRSTETGGPMGKKGARGGSAAERRVVFFGVWEGMVMLVRMGIGERCKRLPYTV